MSEQKLNRRIDQVEIKRSGPIKFKDKTINKIKKQNINFVNKYSIFILNIKKRYVDNCHVLFYYDLI